MSRSFHPLLLTLIACACGGAHDSRTLSTEASKTANVSTAIVRLEHANATELAATVDELLEASSRALEGWWGHAACALPHPGTEAEMWRELREPFRLGVRVCADPRTNSLVLTAESEADSASVIELIGRLDEDADRPR